MRWIAVLGVLVLAACGPRGEVVVDRDAGSVGTVERIFVAGNRNPDNQPARGLSFHRIDVSVPPDRTMGTVRYPKTDGKPDPRREFLVTADDRLDGPQGFRAAIERELAGRPVQESDIILFIHGFNTSYGEGVYRYAQIAHDLKFPGIRTHFSWVSHTKALAYAADRDSLLYSRDDLVTTIQTLAATRGHGKLILVAHSMGAELLMESLRQLALTGRRDVLKELDGVVLQAPDINVNVFRAQAKAIGDLPQPFFIFTSQSDRALRLSALISNQSLRLGTLQDPRAVADLDVVLVDVSQFNTGIGHFNAATSPTLIRILSSAQELERMFSGNYGSAQNPFGAAAIRVQQAAQIVVSP
ncbi:alpha/beta hydrolase [Paracoccus zhejiangensis]|uniref:Esterase n=1 Tax=Paracoccus zhejiangensis TaxID=1077935 RepID=A0A2H5F0Q9_9RHOB|nr:alpha/beta fold hydrolase [Paracoccus zhejiangensis]AUH65135.1 hypothetical protein CX676_13925 [Paracoccus zhejiangensis]